MAGKLFGCGENWAGQLGLGDLDDRNIFTQIGTDSWKYVSSYYHTMSIKSDDTLWSCGWNEAGQLGLGDENDRDVLTQVGTATWKSVTCGFYHTMSIKSDDTLWSCGGNTRGQLGLGDNTKRDTLTQVGSATWKSIACGEGHTVAIKSDDTLWSCGENFYGELGLGDSGSGTNRNTLTQIGSDTWLYVSCGYGHTFAIKSDGTLWSWGTNWSGELGLGDSGSGTNRNTPTQVGTATWKSVACGFRHAVVIKSDDTLWSCGWNDYGQLGLGDLNDRNTLTQVDSGSWKQIACGGANTLAIKPNDTLWACGWSEIIGLESIGEVLNLTQIGTSKYSYIAGGDFSSFIILINEYNGNRPYYKITSGFTPLYSFKYKGASGFKTIKGRYYNGSEWIY